MRHIRALKQSGDIHLPELEDEFDNSVELEAPTPRVESMAPARQPSLVPLFGLLAGVFVLYRLIR